jgi:glycosyltransferase involved in cell wall biosynthesis
MLTTWVSAHAAFIKASDHHQRALTDEEKTLAPAGARLVGRLKKHVNDHIEFTEGTLDGETLPANLCFIHQAHWTQLPPEPTGMAAADSRKLKVAACLMIKDDVHRVQEWIAFHRVIGFDSFIIYDNNSTDGTTELLQRAAHVFDVRVIPWQRTDWNRQRDAYTQTIRQYQNEFDWIAFIDADEFIVLKQDETIQDFLARYDADQVLINWAMFGSNGHIERPTTLMIDAFTYRSDTRFASTLHVKSIMRPQSLIKDCFNPHAFEVRGKTVDVLGDAPVWEKFGVLKTAPVYDLCQINHYYVKSWEEWEVKMRRGSNGTVGMSIDPKAVLDGFNYADRNKIFDPSALKYAARTHANLALMAGWVVRPSE